MDATELAFAGIARQAELIAAGEVSARELVETYLARIERLNPALNAIRVVFSERVLLEAGQADARRAGGDRRPLLGVPLLVKDDIDVAGEVTAVGTRAHGGPVAQDAEVVRRLRAAGALILGKTLTPELCLWPFTESVTFGATANPWSTDRTPGGSSGGSGAAVAAGLAGAALGSDGGGSIRIPAAWCGLYGLKSTRGLVPMAPRTQTWSGLAVNGVLARSVADTALFHDAVWAPDAQNPPPLMPRRPFSEAVREDPRALRIAVATNLPPGVLAPLHRDNRAALDETMLLLRSLGHEVREAKIEYGGMTVLHAFNARYFRGIHEEAASMAHPERLERRSRAMARVGGWIPRSLRERLLAREADVAEHLNRVLREHDVLVTPVTCVPAPEIGRFEGRGALWTYVGVARQMPYCPAWNLVGQPACSVPAGFGEGGLPRAVQLVGRPNDESTLLSLSAQIERARPWAQARPPLASLKGAGAGAGA